MKQPDMTWLHSRPALILRAAAALVLAYVLASLAIDTGRWLHYFLALLCVLLAMKFLIRAVGGSRG